MLNNILMNQVVVWLLSSFILAFSFFPQALSAESPHNFEKWENDMRAFERLDQTNPPPKGGLLFIGSSTINFGRACLRISRSTT